MTPPCPYGVFIGRPPASSGVPTPGPLGACQIVGILSSTFRRIKQMNDFEDFQAAARVAASADQIAKQAKMVAARSAEQARRDAEIARQRREKASEAWQAAMRIARNE